MIIKLKLGPVFQSSIATGLSHLGHLDPFCLSQSGLSGADPKYSGIRCIVNCNIRSFYEKIDTL